MFLSSFSKEKSSMRQMRFVFMEVSVVVLLNVVAAKDSLSWD